MPRTPYIESSLSALQNWGGYLRVSVLDNPSDKIFRALSWLLAATSAFVYISPPPYLPLISIGTSSEPHREITERQVREKENKNNKIINFLNQKHL